MKKFTTIITAALLVLCFTQCRKELKKVTPDVEEAYTITLDVSGDSKLSVNTGTGEVNFTANDSIFVAYNGKYIGSLGYDGGKFTGSLSVAPPETGSAKLYFYFLGNKTPNTALIKGSSTSVTIDIVDQTTSLPVISAAKSIEDYEDGRTNYTAILANKCSLVRFDVTGAPASSTICVEGFNNTAKFSFSSTDIQTIGKKDNGLIKIKTEANVGWAILLAQATLPGSSYSTYTPDYSYIGNNATSTKFTSIEINKLYNKENEGFKVNLTSYTTPSIITGDDGLFSVSADKKVRFSLGNLVYNKSNGTWNFLAKQLTMVETGPVHVNYGSEVYVSLFGWGTSGQNLRGGSETDYYYRPYNTDANFGEYYGPSGNYSLTGTYSAGDWGFNPISNSTYNGWRTLTINEWNYVLNNRTTSYKYVKASISGVWGLIIFPDNWNPANYEFVNYNTANAEFTANKVNLKSWSVLESKGAVFLPASGYRSAKSVSNAGTNGYYWSTTSKGGAMARLLYFSKTTVTITGTNLDDKYYRRFRGYSVRLVKDED